MPTNNFYTSLEQQNAQREYLTETAVQYQNESDVYSMVQDAPDEQINAKGLKQPIETSANPSTSVPNLDGGATPTIGSRNLDYFQVTYAPLMQGSGDTYEALLNNNKETAEDEIMRNIKSDAKQHVWNLNNQFSRGAGTPAIATASASYDGSNATTKRTFVANGTTDTIGGSQTTVKQWCTIWSSDGATQRTAGAVPSTGVFQVDSKTTANIVFVSGTELPTDYVSGDILCPEIGTTTAETAIYGLPKIINDTGLYFSRDRTVAPYTGLKSYVLGSAGSLTAGMFSTTYFSIQQRGGYFPASLGGELIDSLWILLGVTQKANYYNLSLNSGAVVSSPNTFRHTESERPMMDLGMKNFEFTWFNAPMKTCNSVRGDEIYFANPKYFKKAVLKQIGELPGTMPQSGNIWMVNADGVPILARASYRDWIGQFYSPEPFKLGKISGITVTNLPAQKSLMA